MSLIQSHAYNRASQKTYSRRTNRDSSSYEPAAKKRKIDTEGMTVKSSNTRLPLAPTNPPSSLPSTPARENVRPSSILPAEDAVTPPSSPPSRPLPPTKKPRRCAFSSLRRQKPSMPGASPSKADVLPLRDITNTPQRPPPAQSKKKKHKRPPRLTQMTIDLGQPMQRSCKTCGMDYIPSSAEDSALHHAFHTMNVGGVDLGRGPLKMLTSKKIWSASEEVAHVAKQKGTRRSWVAVVDYKSTVAERNTVRKVLDVVTADLSAVEIDDAALWSQVVPSKTKSKGSSAEEKTPLDNSAEIDGDEEVPRFRAYLYINDSKCIGLCLAERISSAFRVLESTGVEGTATESRLISSRSSSISIAVREEPATLGVSRIWTSNGHRRRGVASTLLECARSNSIFGITLPKGLMAFSQPTASGGSLAAKWFGPSEPWKVYLED